MERIPIASHRSSLCNRGWAGAGPRAVRRMKPVKLAAGSLRVRIAFVHPIRSVPGVPVALLATVMNAIAWLVPVARLRSDSLGLDRVPMIGWQAFATSLFPFDVGARISASDPLFAVLSLASALTNLMFIVALAILLPGGDRSPRTWRRVEAALWVCFGLNGWWLATGVSHLLAGYYLWLGSFALLALAVRQHRGAERHPIPPRVT